MNTLAGVLLAAGWGAGLVTVFLTPAPRREREPAVVVWDPTPQAVEATPGPLVYLARKRGTDEVKVGWTARSGGRRVGEWMTGVSAPVDVEGLVQGGRDVEAALHRAFRADRIHNEWFRLPRDGAWRARVEEVAGA